MTFLCFRASALPALMLGVLCFSAATSHAQGSASLRGQATNAEGQPLQHAVVQLISSGTAPSGHARRYTLIGDALGKFSQEGLAPGAYLVMLFTDGKGTNVLRSVQLNDGQTQALNLALTPTVQLAGALSMDERRRISGQTR